MCPLIDLEAVPGRVWYRTRSILTPAGAGAPGVAAEYDEPNNYSPLLASPCGNVAVNITN
jgi:hypothetical protein